MPLYTEPYDTADYLQSDELIVAYLTEELNSNEPFYMAKALATVARAKGGIGPLSKISGVAQEDLRRAMDTDRIDRDAILRAMAALGARRAESIAA